MRRYKNLLFSHITLDFLFVSSQWNQNGPRKNVKSRKNCKLCQGKISVKKSFFV
jgi:hypothetical protein